MQAAQAAGDHALAGHLVVRMAGHNIELAQPRQVLNYLHATRQPGNGAAFTHGELSNQHAIAAWANAQADNAQNVLREAGSAEEHLAAAEHRTGPDWQVRHTAEAELYSLTGAGYTELAKHQPRYAGEAISRLTLALELRGADGARNATLDTISLAEAHLADHDLSQAAQVTGNAVLLARDSASDAYASASANSGSNSDRIAATRTPKPCSTRSARWLRPAPGDKLTGRKSSRWCAAAAAAQPRRR
jgi:hypothetical protein